jgi:6-phosphogluconolactonase
MTQTSPVARYLLCLLGALLFPLSAMAHHRSVGAVYTMTNEPDGNAVLVFDRDRFGRLSPAGRYPTGGMGTGAALGNQGAVILDPANRWLFVANPGSDQISVFSVAKDGLSLVDEVSSNGVQPISLTYARNLLYVLNAGGDVGKSDTITGFRVGADGTLTPITHSTRALSADATGPAQIQFNSDGDVLVVTEKASNSIDTYTVDNEGIPSGPKTYGSVGKTPFGFAFGKRDQLFVSEAAGGAEDASSVSSYSVAEDGGLEMISSAVGTTETAACWVVVSHDGRFAYTTNAGSGSVSAYRIAFDGSIRLRDRNGRTGLTGKDSAPIDMALSNDGRNLYTLNSGNATLSAFWVGPDGDGGLVKLRRLWGLPASANGLAAR